MVAGDCAPVERIASGASTPTADRASSAAMSARLRVAFASASDTALLAGMLVPDFPAHVVAWLDYSCAGASRADGAPARRGSPARSPEATEGAGAWQGSRRAWRELAEGVRVACMRGLQRGRAPLRRLAREHGLAVLAARESAPDVVAAFLRRHRVDVLVACTCPLLPASIIEAPRAASVNVHPSLLPAWRGGAPGFWQLVRGEPRSGVTVHLIDEGIDTGPILAQRAFALRDGMTRREFEDLAFGPAIGAAVLAEALVALADAPAATGARDAGVAGVRTVAGKVQPVGSPTPPARGVSAERLRELLAAGEFGPDEAWRALRYFDGHDGVIAPAGGLRRWHVWRAASYDERACAPAGTLRVERVDGCRWLLHPRGRVRLDERVAPVRVARWFWRALTRR